jgi:hypothetical protein
MQNNHDITLDGEDTSEIGVPCSISGGVSPVILAISAASSETWGSTSWLGPFIDDCTPGLEGEVEEI